MKAESSVELFTGIRPTGDLTVANYVGAVKPFIDLQEKGLKALVFVADMHALTDHEPAIIKKYTKEVVADYLALGLDPRKMMVFVQSEIALEISYLTILLSRLMTVSELLRVPTLKDKLKNNARPETANALLLLYPVMMAADILVQRARKVPVGKDQVAHLEVSRKIARDFNSRYGEIFPIPEVYQLKALRILSLKGAGKMSKSSPDGAIFLTDDPKAAAKKIKSAETAFEGKMSDSLASHITLAKELSASQGVHSEIDQIIKEHLDGKLVMGKFKSLLSDIVAEFLVKFQSRRKEILDNADIEQILKDGAIVAHHNAEETLKLVRKALI